jgi:hypothetical protein
MSATEYGEFLKFEVYALHASPSKIKSAYKNGSFRR